jgi:hypothetical protein
MLLEKEYVLLSMRCLFRSAWYTTWFVIPTERQRSDEESHTKLTNLANECSWKSRALCSGWDASFIGMTICASVFKRPFEPTSKRFRIKCGMTVLCGIPSYENEKQVFERHPNQREEDSASSAKWQFLYCFFIIHQVRNDNPQPLCLSSRNFY